MYRASKIINLNEARLRGITGKNIVVAVLDTGMGKHPDLIGKTIFFKDFVNGNKEMYDDFGHGTHVSGILAGSGVVESRLKGVAPDVKIVSLKVLDKYGNGKRENVTEAFRWIAENYQKYQIQIVNISVGTAQRGDKGDERLLAAVEKLWNLGLVVVCAAGNLGPSAYSITAPGNSKKVITVGALQEYRMRYSGRGPTADCICKPDLVAPGSYITSCRADWGRERGYYCVKSGTSMATPMVTGAIALLLEKSPGLTNVDIKMRLKESVLDMGEEHAVQGWGLLNVEKLLHFE